MLLEVCDETAAQARFLCQASVNMRVCSAVEHVARVSQLRAELSAVVSARAASATGNEAGTKRAHDAEAIADASTLLSPTAVQLKVVSTIERLEAVLAALRADSGAAEVPAPKAPCRLFFAGRWLDADKLLSEYVGTNEKSKVRVVFGRLEVAGEADEVSAQTATSSSDAPPSATVASSTAEIAPQPPLVGDSAALTEATAQKKSAVSLSTFFGRSSSAGSTEPLANAGEADDADDAAPILSADQASSLTASVPVRAALRDPRLQEVLRHIDSAETRDAALRRLEVALKDPDFEQFSVAALREIGYSAADREK